MARSEFAVRWVVRHRAALLAALALLTGWALLTWGVASLLVWQVWPISAGLLLVSIFGWRLFGRIAVEGLYSLTR